MQVLEQSRQAITAQKQKVQSDLFEIDNALKELESVDSGFKIVGGIMIKADADSLKKELGSKKESLDLRIKTLDMQELKLKEKAKKLQDEVMSKE